jgi:transposase
MLWALQSFEFWKEQYIALEKRFLALEQRCRELEAENHALREKLNTNSKNSSKPPSQDPFRKSRSTKSTGKKQGGQPGHPGHKRKVYPIDQVTTTIDLRPNTCPHCSGTNFNQTPISVEIRQVIELPEMPPDITQYQIHTCKCLCCGKSRVSRS